MNKQISPYADGGLIWPIQNDAKKLKNDWNPGKWVLIWKYIARAFQWIPTWQGLDDFQICLRHCALGEVALALEGLSHSCMHRFTDPVYREELWRRTINALNRGTLYTSSTWYSHSACSILKIGPTIVYAMMFSSSPLSLQGAWGHFSEQCFVFVNKAKLSSIPGLFDIEQTFAHTLKHAAGCGLW